MVIIISTTWMVMLSTRRTSRTWVGSGMIIMPMTPTTKAREQNVGVALRDLAEVRRAPGCRRICSC